MTDKEGGGLYVMYFALYSSLDELARRELTGVNVVRFIRWNSGVRNPNVKVKRKRKTVLWSVYRVRVQ